MGADLGAIGMEAGKLILEMHARRARLAARVSVMIFPEGTRSKTPEMLPFKDGAFRLELQGSNGDTDPASRARADFSSRPNSARSSSS